MSNPKAPKFVDAKGRNRVDGGVFSVNDESGEIYLDKTWVGLSNVDNTSDLNKPVSTATAALVEESVDSVIRYMSFLITFTQDYVADDTLLITTLPANCRIVSTGGQYIPSPAGWGSSTDFNIEIGTLADSDLLLSGDDKGFNNFGFLQDNVAHRDNLLSTATAVYMKFKAVTNNYETIVGKQFRIFFHYVQE